MPIADVPSQMTRLTEEQLELQRRIDEKILSSARDGDHVGMSKSYMEWGDRLIEGGSVDEGCFYLTQSYILALENNLDTVDRLHRVLVELGREHPASE